eukprot:13656136-Heterocapsa_arctica.AAC.1
MEVEDPTGQGDPCIESPHALALLEDDQQGVSVQQLRRDLIADLLEHALQLVEAIMRQGLVAGQGSLDGLQGSRAGDL